MKTQQVTRASRKAQVIREQEQWIESRGGTLAGYVANYGSKDDAKHYGNGGEAIYAADVAYLEKLKQA